MADSEQGNLIQIAPLIHVPNTDEAVSFFANIPRFNATLSAIAFQVRNAQPKLAEAMDDVENAVQGQLCPPPRHRVKRYSSNDRERLNMGVKRQADVVGIFRAEASITELVSAGSWRPMTSGNSGIAICRLSRSLASRTPNKKPKGSLSRRGWQRRHLHRARPDPLHWLVAPLFTPQAGMTIDEISTRTAETSG